MAVSLVPPPIPRRISLDDFSDIDNMQKTITSQVDQLNSKSSVSHQFYSASNTKNSIHALIETLKLLSLRKELSLEQRLEIRGCKYNILQAQEKFLQQVKDVFEENKPFFDFGHSSSLPEFHSSRSRIEKLSNDFSKKC